MTKKSAAKLDREIAVALATPAVKISVHQDSGDADEDDEERDDTDDVERYSISDDGGEFDDASAVPTPDVQGDIDERRLHYHAMGRRVVLVAPAGRGWY